MTAEKTPKSGSEDDSFCNLYLMRHGDAAAAEAAGVEADARRPLTPDGKLKMKEICRGLKRLGAELDWVVTSPLVRAVETGVIVAGSTDEQPPLDRCDALAPDGPLEDVVAFLAAHAGRQNVMLVGHEPGLSQFAAFLIGAGQRANLAFKKGGCCLIRFDGPPARGVGLLTWWLTPKILRKVGA